MTDKELKELKDTLWHSADVLRASAHLAANKYGQPILGLIFLRYADILYKQHKEEIEAEYNRLKGGRMEKSIKEISIEKCGFYLPECAYYDFINDAPDDANNSFYSDPYNAFGQFDYVMANPPFNVDEVVVDKVSDDARFNTYGVPRNKSKSTKKKSDKKETVPNANYLWIGYFATALNEHGKAALVMANSASDASGSEYDIRKKMIEEGIISQMVTLPSTTLDERKT